MMSHYAVHTFKVSREKIAYYEAIPENKRQGDPVRGHGGVDDVGRIMNAVGIRGRGKHHVHFHKTMVA